MALGKIIVVGNEKGGTGKSTLSMHLIVSFLHLGKKVASIDLDGRQGTLTHYIENRAAYATRQNIDLPLPEHLVVSVQEHLSLEQQNLDEEAFATKIQDLSKINDIVIIDTPGAHNYLFRLAHVYADILLTPLNDSLIDLDVLASIDSETLTIKTPSHYAQTVWQARQKRARLKKTNMAWFVLRNRVMHVSTRNEKIIWTLMEALGKRIQFTPLSGLGERIIFRELFLKGLTLLDIDNKKSGIELNISHLSARQELRQILAAIGENVS